MEPAPPRKGEEEPAPPDDGAGQPTNYVKYIEKDPSLSASWENYFNTLNEDLNLITKEIEGPIWKKNKKKIF